MAAVLADGVKSRARRARRAAPWVLGVALTLLASDALLFARLPEAWQPVLRAVLGAVIVLGIHQAFGRRDRRTLEDLARQAAALRASEARLAEAQAVAHVGSWELDIATSRLTWSAERFRMQGLEPRAGGLPMAEGLALVHPDDRPGLEEALHRIAASGGSYERELRFLQPAGGVRWVHSRAQFVPGGDGRPGRLVGTSQDITERRLAEEALLEREARLRLALEVAELGTWDADLERGVVLWSPPHERLFGLEPGSFGGTAAAFLAHVHPDDRQQVRLQMAEQLRSRAELRLSFRVLRGGSVRHLNSLGGIVRNGRGRATRVLGVTQDVTELREAEERRGLLFRGEKLRALGQMASGVAHDLNQQFALITGYGQLAALALERQGTCGAAVEVAQALRVLTQAAIDGGRTVARLLTFTRDHEEGPAECVDVGTLLRDVAELTAPHWRDDSQAHGTPVTLRVESEEGLVVKGWPHVLREAVTNLVFNAVDALPRGGSIRLTASCEGGAVVVKVADDGVGMPDHVLARLFEPFFTTKGERGTGLGLAGVYGIVERHGGRMEVASEVGHGSTFTMILPAAAESAVRPADAISTAPAQRQSLRILAVEDEPALRRMLATILERLGHATVTAASGEEALQLLGETDFDVLLTDLGLGSGINGWELVEQARRMRPQLEAVLATGWGAQIDPVQARARGVHGVISKPYSIADLQRTLESRAAA